MANVRESSDRFELSEWPWFVLSVVAIFVVFIPFILVEQYRNGNATVFLLVLIGAPILLIGAGGAAAEFVYLVADRKGGSVICRRRTLFQKTGWVTPLDDVEVAVLNEAMGEDGPMFRPALRLTDGSLLLIGETYQGARAARKTRDRINAWLSADVDSTPLQA